MKPIVPADIKGPAIYAGIRDDYRKRIIEYKEHRRIEIGDRVFLVFENRRTLVFQIEEILQNGAFVGRCTEMCGTYHSMMNFELRVVSPNDFRAYLEQREDGKTNAEALQAIDQNPLAVTTQPFDTRRGEQAPKLTQASK